MKNVLLLTLLLATTSKAFSQNPTKQEKGYFNLTELKVYFGNHVFEYQFTENINNGGTNSAYSIGLYNINGWFITNNISIGLGIGLESYRFNKNSFVFNNLFPAFVDARYYFKNKANTFFAYGNAGTSLKLSHDFDKGDMYGLGIGYKFKVAQKTAMTGSLGYNDQTIKNPIPIVKDRYYGFAFKVGLLF